MGDRVDRVWWAVFVGAVIGMAVGIADVWWGALPAGVATAVATIPLERWISAAPVSRESGQND